MITREESSSAAILEALVLAEQLDAAVDGVLRPDRCQASTDPPIVLHHSTYAGGPINLPTLFPTLKISLSASPSSGWSNSNPLFNNFVGSIRALASSVLVISPKISRRMNRGTGNMVGREIARPNDFVNSVFVTGLGVATIVGPMRESFSSICKMALVMSWRVIQGM